nr:DUF5615 family PIN-like protein [Hymenobacter oligotrophus]
MRDLGLDNSPDSTIWQHAQAQGWHIVTKDEDFVRLLLTHGFPPKVIVVTNAQVPARALTVYLGTQLERIRHFLFEQPESGMLVLRMP